jgi:hypothetical protein
MTCLRQREGGRVKLFTDHHVTDLSPHVSIHQVYTLYVHIYIYIYIKQTNKLIS